MWQGAARIKPATQHGGVSVSSTFKDEGCVSGVCSRTEFLACAGFNNYEIKSITKGELEPAGQQKKGQNSPNFKRTVKGKITKPIIRKWNATKSSPEKVCSKIESRAR
ncbi:hypothetical protein AVEN_121531-1 [Araneus ventricosus]|uniref:Uncharacterized protein n=1 Tax=Araneus ventricosus TaxID=182803 RepID=A0A4Y2URC6_ARAVE|nr:hypothetical protein AVEN_121531-1 [Araneus ventricosus]